MFHNKLVLPFLLGSLLFGAGAFANSSPSSALVTVYGVAVSLNTDCSNAHVLGYNPAGAILDFTKGPSITNAGVIDPGTYPCVILYMSNAITFTPATSDAPNCVGGTTYTRVVCNAGGGGGGCQFTTASPDASNTLVYGALQTAKAASSSDVANAEKVLLFLSTASTSTGNGQNAFQQPTAGNLGNGLKLASPFVVSATGGAGTFVVNFDGQINGTQNPCDLGPPTFAFR